MDPGRFRRISLQSCLGSGQHLTYGGGLHSPWRQTVNVLYALYDALVSIQVPGDKARAVVDALERDMSTTLATKGDLLELRTDLKGDLQAVRAELKTDIQALRDEFKTNLQALREEFKGDLQALREEFKGDLQALRQELTAEITSMKADIAGIRTEVALLRKGMEHLATAITVRLGGLVVLVAGLLFAALRNPL